MNANQIINMIVRMLMRRMMRGGINAGIDAVGRRMGQGRGTQAKDGQGHDGQARGATPGQHPPPPDSKQVGKRARQTLRMARRMGRM